MNQNKDKKDKKQSNISKIEVDRDLCIGAGPCVALAPNTFQLDDEGKAFVLGYNGNNDEEIIDAAMSCPVMAIKIYDKKGNLIYPT